MGKQNQNKEAAKEKARAYLRKASEDGKLTNNEIARGTERGISLDRILNRAANQGTVIGDKAKENYGITQGSNRNRIDYAPVPDTTSPRAIIESQFSPPRDKNALPEAQKRGVYAGVNDKGTHVYRYGTGRPKQSSSPSAAEQTQPSVPADTNPDTTYQTQSPVASPTGGKSWSDFVSETERPQAQTAAAEEAQVSPAQRSSYSSPSYRSDTDPGNPDLYGAVANSGQDYQRKFDRFVDYFDASARAQAWEVGDAGRQALSRLQAKPPKLTDPLSKKTARQINRFSNTIDFG